MVYSLLVAVVFLLFASSSSSGFVAIPSRHHTVETTTTTTFRLSSATDNTARAAAVVAAAAKTTDTLRKKKFRSFPPKPKKIQSSLSKKKKQQQQQPTTPPPPPKKKGPKPSPPLAIDISRLDIRVGLITKAWIHEGEHQRMYCTDVNIGGGDDDNDDDDDSNTQRQLITTGPFLKVSSPEELVGQKVLVVVNVKPKKVAGFLAHGKLLCARKYGGKEFGGTISEEDVEVEFVVPHVNAQLGDRVVTKGYEYNNKRAATANFVQKKKLIRLLFPDLRINNNGFAVYKRKQLVTTTPTTSTTTKTAATSEKLPCKSITLTNVRIA